MCEKFKANGIDCVNAPADADVMIAKKGIEHARETVTNVIGEGTDLLVLLGHYAERGMNEFCTSSRARKVGNVGILTQ